MDVEDEIMDAVCDSTVAYEVDLDYEFDAPRFFDFTREESRAEAALAGSWFQSARTYPPSPFAMKLIVREAILDSVKIYPESKDEANMTWMDCKSDTVPTSDASVMGVTNGGLAGQTFTTLQTDHLPQIQGQTQLPDIPTGPIVHHTNGNPKVKAKTVGPCFSRSSTLMKPTASHLAKQIPPSTIGDSRLQVPSSNGNARILNNCLLTETQAAKRQKLEGGLPRKVGDTKKAINLVHKPPKKEGSGGSTVSMLRITVPREPHLETACRAQRTRPRSGTEIKREYEALTATGLRACPLSRKDLKKPTTNSHGENGDKNKRRPKFSDASKQAGSDLMPQFKARPLNKKIFTSKGDIGIFRNSKRTATVPMEFSFNTEKRNQHEPPIELFNKLCLQSDVQQDARSQLKSPQLTHLPMKGCKENRLGVSQQEHEMNSLKAKPVWHGHRIHCKSNGDITQIGLQSGMVRSQGIR